MINISYFYDLLESMGDHCRLGTCGFIFCAHAGAHLCQWARPAGLGGLWAGPSLAASEIIPNIQCCKFSDFVARSGEFLRFPSDKNLSLAPSDKCSDFLNFGW